jgi:hypothetical protein
MKSPKKTKKHKFKITMFKRELKRYMHGSIANWNILIERLLQFSQHLDSEA